MCTLSHFWWRRMHASWADLNYIMMPSMGIFIFPGQSWFPATIDTSIFMSSSSYSSPPTQRGFTSDLALVWRIHFYSLSLKSTLISDPYHLYCMYAGGGLFVGQDTEDILSSLSCSKPAALLMKERLVLSPCSLSLSLQFDAIWVWSFSRKESKDSWSMVLSNE